MSRWHHWETWECVPAGMYETLPPKGMDADAAMESYREFLADLGRFESAIKRVMIEWPISCDQFLSNSSINRVAWIGQSSMCIATGIPACFRGGFRLLTEEQQNDANAMAEWYLQMWLSFASPRPSEASAIPRGMQQRIAHYIATWRRRGYEQGIPNEVPSELMRLNLAPSYRAIALAILRNDHACQSLGYTPPHSSWYQELKHIEIIQRG